MSDVTITRSASRAAISPISGRLARSRSPPAPKTTITRPVGDLARGRAAPSPARPACARSRRARANSCPSSTACTRPGTGRDVRERRGHHVELEPERVRRGHRHERVGGVEAPAQRQLDRRLAGGRADGERVAAEPGADGRPPASRPARRARP